MRIEGAMGRISLSRPQALNALTHQMALGIESALLEWQANDDVVLVMIDAEGGKAFCAGGDVNTLYQQGIAGDFASGRQFWIDEYRLNALIDRYPKPYVAIMDGIVMGGGIGISAHGSHRIVTERSILALPECSIGLVPDVGASYLLSKSPGRLGEYLALTGERFNASDALFAGFADYFVPSERLAALKDALIETADVKVIESFHQSSAHSSLADSEHRINAAFGQGTLLDVIDQLGQVKEDWAQSALKKLGHASPLSLFVALDLVREARQAPGIEQALVREYRFVARAMESGDFLEGVRAALIDRDRQPVWKHSSVGTVPRELIDKMKQPVPEGEPVFTSLQG